MLQQFANGLASYLLKKKIVKQDDYEIYTYGIEAILSTLLNTIIVLFLGIAIGMIFETLIFLVAFAILRVYCGGYHSKSHWGCVLTFSALYGFSMLIISFLPSSASDVFSLVATGVSLCVIFILAPLEHANRPFVGNEHKVFRLLSRIIAIIEAGAIVLFLFSKHRHLHISLSLSLAMLCVAFILVYGKIKVGGEKNK